MALSSEDSLVIYQGGVLQQSCAALMHCKYMAGPSLGCTVYMRYERNHQKTGVTCRYMFGQDLLGGSTFTVAQQEALSSAKKNTNISVACSAINTKINDNKLNY